MAWRVMTAPPEKCFFDPLRRKLLLGAGAAGLFVAGACERVRANGYAGGNAARRPSADSRHDAASVRPGLCRARHHAIPAWELLPLAYALPSDDWRSVEQAVRDPLRPLGASLRRLGAGLRERWASVFILGLSGRGPDNRRKRIYLSALTADLYPLYAERPAHSSTGSSPRRTPANP